MLKRVDMGVLEAQARVAAETPGLDLREALNFVWRRWKFIAVIAMLFLLIGALYVARQTPLYTATTQLLLDRSREKAAGQDAVLSDVALDATAVESQFAIIRSSTLLIKVVEKERLVNDPEFGFVPSGSGSGLLAAISSFFGRSARLAVLPSTGSNSSRSGLNSASPETIATANNLQGAVNASQAGQAYVLNVSFTSADPNKAARLANAVADAYVVDKLDARFEAAKRASSWLADRLVDLRKQLRASEEAVAQFRVDNDLVQAGAGATLNQEQLAQLNGRLVGARGDTAEKKSRLDLLQRIQAGGGNISALPDMMNSGSIADLRKQEDDLSRQVADLLTRYTDRHPSVVNLRAQLADVHRAITAEIVRLTSNIKNEYELAKAREEGLEKTLRDATGQNDLDNSKAITLRELERTAAVDKNLFEDFLQRAKVTEEQATFETRNSRVISAAQAPGAPSSPKTGLILAISLAFGLFAGAGGAYIVELLNNGFTTPRQVEELLEVPLLASI